MKPDPTEAVPTPGARVEYQVSFATGPKGRKRVRAMGEAAPTPPPRPSTPVGPPPRAAAVAPPVAPPQRPAAPEAHPLTVVVPTSDAPAPALTPRVPKIALLLVLGHHFERLVRDGGVQDYAEIGRRTGLTRARVTQIVNLTLLAPEIQERILDLTLTAEGDDPVHERRFRAAVGKPAWASQRASMSTVR